MRRHRIDLKYKKIRLGFPKSIPPKLTIIALVLFLVVLFSTIRLVKFLRGADYFKIKEIFFSQDCKLELSQLEGRNIFTINPGQISRYILRYHPIYRNVRVVRVLPNRIFVNLTRRKPKAIIKLYRDFYVDKDAILFDEVGRSALPQDLPVISGLEKKIKAPKLGTRYNIEELAIALDILRRIEQNKVLKEYKFRRIYIENPSKMSFFMLVSLPPKGARVGQAVARLNELEIKIDAHNIREKFGILTGILSQVRDDFGKIKYIDLRFKEPVIKFNEGTS